MTDITIDVGAALPFLWNQVLGLFGLDDASVAVRRTLDLRLRTGQREASHIQVIGMHQPVPLELMYQATRIIGLDDSEPRLDMVRLLAEPDDLIIFGLPGYGKTTLLRHIYLQMSRDHSGLPILYSLRRPGTAEELVRLVDHLANNPSTAKKLRKQGKLLLLVDGFDEAPLSTRRTLIEALQVFQSLELGAFFLTSRLFYNVDNLHARHVRVAPFDDTDALRFMEAFGRGAGVHVDSVSLLQELKDHACGDFAAHPLLLTLVCIVRTGPNPTLPGTTIGLIKRAISTLTLRWDASKHITRDSVLPLDGESRVECLMRVAFGMDKLEAQGYEVYEPVRQHLRLAQQKNIDPEELLMEIAQWYGLLIPLGDDRWTFAHKSIHDYLAARYWVENGEYDPERVRSWDACAAYAACMLHDATKAMARMLRMGAVYAFSECLYNAARFNCRKVATAVVGHFRNHPNFQINDVPSGVEVSASDDFFRLASDNFIEALADCAAAEGGAAGTVVLAFALAEAHRRQLRVSNQAVKKAMELAPAIFVRSETRTPQQYSVGSLKTTHNAAW